MLQVLRADVLAGAHRCLPGAQWRGAPLPTSVRTDPARAAFSSWNKLHVSKVGDPVKIPVVDDTSNELFEWDRHPHAVKFSCGSGKFDMSEVTRILAAIERGDTCAADKLLPLVYEQLRAIARQRMAEERAGHTLQATALVHEAYLRLVGGQEVAWANRAHFYLAAAEAMRRILIEHGRKRNRIKRGGDRRRAPVSVVDLAAEQDSEEIVAVDDAIRRLGEEDAQAAKVVRLRFFAGLSVDEAARALDLSPRTVAREWAYARAWLHQAMEGGE